MKKTFLLILLMRLSFIGLAQGIETKEYHFNRISIKNGLPEEVITTMLQDKYGYMWIGTQAGLVRYNGYETKVYQFGEADPNHSSINYIFEDRAGNMWVGTWINGLYLYKRETDDFTRYAHDPKDSNSIAFGKVSSIQDDTNGDLWMILEFFGGGSQINRFDVKTKTFHRFGNSQKGAHHVDATEFNSILSDARGKMWFGSNNGIYEYSASGDQLIPHFSTPDVLKQKKFNQLTADPSDSSLIWMSVTNNQTRSGEGVWCFNSSDRSVKTYQHKLNDTTSLANDNVVSIQKDSKGRLWFGEYYGLSVFEPRSKSFINYTTQEKRENPWELGMYIVCEDRDGNFWCGCQQNLFICNEKSKTIYRYIPNEKNPDDLQSNGYTNVITDHSGIPWVGTAFQGLNWVNQKRAAFTIYKNAPGQPHYFPGGGYTSFVQNKDGTFWIWSANGLFRWYPKTDSFILTKEMKNPGEKTVWHFSAMIVDRQGLIWCNSIGNGLYCYDPKTRAVKNYRPIKNDSNSIYSYNITSICEDKNGLIWIGTFGDGLCSFDPQTKKFKRYPFIVNHVNTPNNGALDDNTIFYIYEDKAGTIWVGTNSGGLNRFNRETGTFTSYQNQLPGFMTISSIFEDNKGRLWSGTHEGGLFLFDRNSNTSKKLSEKDGLLYDGSLGINIDNQNNLWVLSQRGISIINSETNNISHLTTKNGLPEEPENNLNFYKSHDGRMFMPCNNGFIVIDPEKMKPDTVLPIVHIESLEISRPQIGGINQKDSLIYTFGKEKIGLRYNENRITFNYVGLQYQNSALNEYAYKLDGYDKDWIQAGTQRKVTYTNLSPDTYIFRVKASNSDGVWNPEEQSFTIVISPPWWLTWWAYVCYALILGAAVWAFVNYRARALIMKNVVLEDKIAHRTNQLKQSIEDLKSTQTQLIQSEKMASLGELTAGIAHEIQNPLNFVNNFSDVNTELLTEMKEEMAKGNLPDAESIANDIIENEQKINHHGKRADAIVKGMLLHSRSNTGVKEPADVNVLAEEYLKLAYHGLRAKDKSFNAATLTDFDETIGKINIMPQEIGRVFLNLINNAFYAVSEKKKQQPDGYDPKVIVITRKTGNHIEIRVSDNGNGIPQKIADKIFQPFFTTKPAGQGTGLGLSLSYDIVKAHGGEIKIESRDGEGSDFIVMLPKNV
jgi:signal transduction histidine kinase/ligand-binding sensor domain-containing protein